ncbi:glycosyltransferase [Candidatus Peregrinibacteria bacterium]|nr:glycosyltransferase [Candidatus Peregrinibacteria bacterium]
MVDAHIAVLLPTYEPYPPFLTETLDSLLRQTEQRWSCLIHDDASTVDVRAIVEPYLSAPRITFARNPRRLGIGGNWNACLGEARRAKPDIPFIQFLFQDDLWHPRYLERSCAVLQEHPDIGFVASAHVYHVMGRMETAEGYRRLEEEKKSRLAPGRHDGIVFLRNWLWRGLEQNIIGEPSFVMMRRSLVEEVGPFFQDLHQLLDVEYWVRALLKAHWYYLPEELGIFRVHRKGASYLHFLRGEQMGEHLHLLERLRSILPVGTSEREQLESSLDERFSVIIKHVVNRCIRRQSIGTGAWPVLRHFQKHPAAACRGMRLYAAQASKRWYKKMRSAHRSKAYRSIA